MTNAGTVISTWFVADQANEGTYFPQIGMRSDAPEAQAVYWRCIACFYASSLAVNPHARHVFFSNTSAPFVDGVDLSALLDRWGIEVVQLPITYRLPKGAVSNWGNQFYIFDVLDYVAAKGDSARTIVLDSDCIWLQPVTAMEKAIDASGALGYFMGGDIYAQGEAINGLTRAQMADFLRRHGGPDRSSTPYYGGEIYAARQEVTERLAKRAKALWPEVSTQVDGAPREEAHLLSILYALEEIDGETANPFIRRMWTTFHHNNLLASDRALAIWHLPSEKKSGFAEMFKRIALCSDLHPARDASAMGLDFATYSRTMGWPRRRPVKFFRDFYAKSMERVTK